MSKDYINPASAATLSHVELFKRNLNAPERAAAGIQVYLTSFDKFRASFDPVLIAFAEMAFAFEATDTAFNEAEVETCALADMRRARADLDRVCGSMVEILDALGFAELVEDEAA